MTPALDWVLDTNVLVSGLLSADGPPGRLIDAFLAQKLRIVLDDRILQEYREVLARPKFPFKPADVLAFWQIIPFQRHIVAMPMKGLRAIDPADTKSLEVATATDSKILVTGNTRHFPKETAGLVLVLSPLEAWSRIS